MKKRLLLAICLLFIIAILASCGKSTIIWQDADGTILETMRGNQSTTRALPQDTTEWHYTGWTLFNSSSDTTVYKAQRVAKIPVFWKDTDGTVLYESSTLPDTPVSEHALPLDTEEWHYTEWKMAVDSSDAKVYIAQRVPKIYITWKDTDGTVLNSMTTYSGVSSLSFSLPEDTFMWDYIEWAEEREDNNYTYTAVRQPNKDYFTGNVFQIITKDLAGEPIATGSGFVFNREGWFITNYHVMEDAFLATAIFEIENESLGESFTKLDIKTCFYFDETKDIFIGKIDNYKKISEHYKDIPIQTKHSVNEITYSVGYPHSSVWMEINQGKTVSDISSLEDKLYTGVSYIGSTSYIAPGSSGGILINENFEVIGLTTRGLFVDDTFILGASISSFNFSNLLTKVNSNELTELAVAMHPNQTKFIKLFRNAINISIFEKIEDENGVYYQMEYIGERDISTLKLYANGYLHFYYEYRFSSANIVDFEELYGVYYDDTELEGFSYSYLESWNSGSTYIALTSDSINYSEDSTNSLKNYKYKSLGNFKPENEIVPMIKEDFNSTYEYLSNLIEIFLN